MLDFGFSKIPPLVEKPQAWRRRVKILLIACSAFSMILFNSFFFYTLFFCIVSSQWSTAVLRERRGYFQGSSLGSKVYFAGGATSNGRSQLVDIYDDSTSTWSVTTFPGPPRSYTTVCSIKTKLIVFGGNLGFV